MPDLREYRQKRDPGETPEPFGEGAESGAVAPGAPRRFVIQQHAARSLHYDLRLEMNGVLVSWAVPRGPSLDPEKRRLAVRTEDHPLEYADFEGCIPEGNYGAGAVIVWDAGRYWTHEGADPAESLRDGKIDLRFEGYKLIGRFALVRTRGADSRQWLLLCKRAQLREGCREDLRPVVEREPRSVLSGLTVSEVRAGESRGPLLRALLEGRAPPPVRGSARWRPMLARSRAEPFDREGWLFETKYDGFRALAHRSAERAELRSREGRDVTPLYPEIARALSRLPLSQFVLDGEIVARDVQGRPSFGELQRRRGRSARDPASAARAALDVPAELWAFDLLAADGVDLRSLPLALRKRLLRCVVPELGAVRFADHIDAQGRALYALAEEHEFEGIVAKRADSPYQVGRRTEAWLKIPALRSAWLRVVGCVPGRGARAELGALLLAGWHPQRRTWVYAGRVGSGLGDAELGVLLERRAEPGAPLEPCVPPELAGRARALREPLAARVRYLELTRAGLLRQPVLLELSEERPAEDCIAPVAAREPPEPPAAPEGGSGADAPLAITRREKCFWPGDGYTKGDLLDYYEAVWPWIAPYLRDRPLVLIRYPDGIEGGSFFQKNAPDWTPRWVTRHALEGTDYLICNELRTLLYAVNSGAIPLHLMSARIGDPEHPDWLVLDLDPSGAPLRDVVRVARELRSLLTRLAYPGFVKSSGQAGLHVMLPLGGQLDHAQARALAEALARAVCAELPGVATVVRPRAGRGGRVYVDYLQNGRGKLLAAPLCARARPGAPVSMPLRWAQVSARFDPRRFTIRTAPRELARRGDPLAGLLEARSDVSALLDALLAEQSARGAVDPEA